MWDTWREPLKGNQGHWAVRTKCKISCFLSYRFSFFELLSWEGQIWKRAIKVKSFARVLHYRLLKLSRTAGYCTKRKGLQFRRCVVRKSAACREGCAGLEVGTASQIPTSPAFYQEGYGFCYEAIKTNKLKQKKTPCVCKQLFCRHEGTDAWIHR